MNNNVNSEFTNLLEKVDIMINVNNKILESIEMLTPGIEERIVEKLINTLYCSKTNTLRTFEDLKSLNAKMNLNK